MLIGSTRIVDPGSIVFECDDFEYCDVTIMTSSMTSRDQTTSRRHFPVGFLLDTNRYSLNRLDSEIFSIKVADTQTEGQRHRHVD